MFSQYDDSDPEYTDVDPEIEELRRIMKKYEPPKEGKRRLETGKLRSNDMVKGFHRYNTDKREPLDEMTSSLESFIASDHSSSEDTSQPQTQEICQPDSQASTNSVVSQSKNVDGGSQQLSYEQSNNGLKIMETPRRRVRDRIDSDEENESESASCEKRTSQNAAQNGDLEVSPYRRSVRVAAVNEEKEKARETMFGQLRMGRESKKARLDELLEPKEEEQEVLSTESASAPKPPSPESPNFHQIGSLSTVRDRSVVNIRGTVVSCGQDDTRPIYAGSPVHVPIRKIRVQDDSGSVEITLWRNYASNENIQEGSSVAMYGLQKSTFREEPHLATWMDSKIEATKAPQFTIDDVNPRLTYVYHACANCRFSKANLQGGRYICSKCRRPYSREDVSVGVTMSIMVRDEHSEYSIQRIFTRSVRKLCPGLPHKWGEWPGSDDDLKSEIIQMVQQILPKEIYCHGNTSDSLEILRIEED